MVQCFTSLVLQVSALTARTIDIMQFDTENLGYPVASLPLVYLDFNGRPFGLQITAKAHQEALLIQAQSAWEATFPRRQPPQPDVIDSEATSVESLNSP